MVLSTFENMLQRQRCVHVYASSCKSALRNISEMRHQLTMVASSACALPELVIAEVIAKSPAYAVRSRPAALGF